MTQISPGTTITANGEYSLTPTHVSAFLTIKGDFGGGTLKLGLVDSAGAFSPVLQFDGSPVEITAPGSIEIMAPVRAVSLTGATDPALVVLLTPKQ
jgi:hypothetical protein